MKQIENTSIYKADKGCFIVRKEDDFIMGEDIDLGSADSIDNYEDRLYTVEEYNLFYASLGIDKHIDEPKINNEDEDKVNTAE